MRFLLPCLFALITGCASVLVARQLDESFGPADPGHFDRPPAARVNAPDYWKDVRPILDHRCVSCHACYDAPCQLNLSSYAGITRGANPTQIYSTRLIEGAPTRLGFDAINNREWRARGFFPVLNERRQEAEANRVGGVMYRLLAMKRDNPGPSSGPITSQDMDFSLDRTQLCVRAEGMDDYIQHHASRGMPFGLPPLAEAEYATLTNWLEAGAPYAPPAPPTPAIARQIALWEDMLNGDDRRSRLVARYIYEHWYIGQFHFREQAEINFELVRSRTPPGQAIEVVATRRPYDDPGVERVYYRLRRLEATAVAKTFMPIELDPARLARIRGWFFAGTYPVDQLPGYDPGLTTNPFVIFRALPVDARYRFMLDEAQFTLGGFMKGPVCRGQIALDVINDHFWVVFQAPGEREGQLTSRLLDAAAPTLNLPSENESSGVLLAWRSFAKQEARYLEIKSKAIVRLASVGADYKLSVASLWNGDGKNPNAALTVFRHFDSASTLRGLVGERPQTALLLGYPLFERMHYLLVAGFDVYSNVGHQLATRLYMDFLRMEGELNFLALLPSGERQKALDHWYRGRKKAQNDYFADASNYFPADSGEPYLTSTPLEELYGKLQKRLAPVREPALDWIGSDLSDAQLVQIRRMSQLKGQPVSHMPEMSLLLLERPGRAPRVVSLIRNSAHSNVAQLFDEEKRRLPDEDSLLAIDGVAGAYPNAIYSLDAEKLPDFVSAVASLGSEADLVKLTERFGVRRTDPRFWPTSDAIHAAWRKTTPREAAILDYSRLENW